MNKQAQYTVSGAIFGAIALLMLAAFSTALYGVFQPNAAPALVLVAAFFGVFAFGSVFATLHAFNQAMKGAQ